MQLADLYPETFAILIHAKVFPTKISSCLLYEIDVRWTMFYMKKKKKLSTHFFIFTFVKLAQWSIAQFLKLPNISVILPYSLQLIECKITQKMMFSHSHMS